MSLRAKRPWGYKLALVPRHDLRRLFERGRRTTPSLHERQRGDLSLQVVVRNGRVVHHDTLEIIVRRIVGVEERTGNIRHEHAGVRLARNIHLVSLDGEGVNEVLEPRLELRRDVLLGRGGRRALREARADGLLDPHDVGQLVPRVGVLDWLEGAVLP